MRRLILQCILLVGALSASANARQVSDLKDDEHLVFFRTSAWLNSEGTHWNVPVHGWVYEPEDSRLRKTAAAELIEKQFDLAPTSETQTNFSSRVNLLLADNERSKSIVIMIADKPYVMPISGADGHFKTTLAIPIEDLEDRKSGTLYFSAILDKNDDRVFYGESILIDQTGWSVISDIDDTVKLTHVTERRKLVDATFFQDFVPVPGMAEKYQTWWKQGAKIHFVSSSPWQLYTPLSDFLAKHEFPISTMSLKSVRFRDETLLNLFKKGTETKPEAIKAIIDRYPGRRFTLVGDSGEQDAEVYAQITALYPDQIDAIWIRNVNLDEDLDQRLKQIFASLPTVKWASFNDASEVKTSEWELSIPESR